MRSDDDPARAAPEEGASDVVRAPVQRRGPRFRAAAIAAGVLIPLLLVECGLRVWHAAQGTYRLRPLPADKDGINAWMASDDPELAYEHRANTVAQGELQIESHGVLRSEDVAAVKPPGLLRVVCIGDSVIASMYLPKPQRATAILERTLTASTARRVEVLNFGVHGYDTFQEARTLETKVPPLSPDAVVVVYCLNDPMVSVIPWNWFKAVDAPWCYTADFVHRALRAARGLPERTRPWAPAEPPSGPVGGPSWRQAYDPEAEGWQSVLQGFDRIAAWSAERRIPVLVAIVPLLLEDDREGRTTAAFRRQVADALRARSLTAVDLQSTFSAFPPALLRKMDFDMYHLGVEGHQVLADALAPHIRRMLPR